MPEAFSTWRGQFTTPVGSGQRFESLVFVTPSKSSLENSFYWRTLPFQPKEYPPFEGIFPGPLEARCLLQREIVLNKWSYPYRATWGIGQKSLDRSSSLQQNAAFSGSGPAQPGLICFSSRVWFSTALVHCDSLLSVSSAVILRPLISEFGFRS